MALAASLQHMGEHFENPGAVVLADALDAATAGYLDNGRSPSRKVNELDNRGSTFYLTLYWAEALAAQTDDAALAERFKPVAAALKANEEQILQELVDAQGPPQNVGGYYMPVADRATEAMCPSSTLNGIIAGI